MAGHDLAHEVEHFVPVLLQLLHNLVHGGQVLEEGQEDQGPGRLEHLESLIEVVHELLELEIAVLEPGGHDDGADHVGGGGGEVFGGIHRRLTVRGQGVHAVQDLGLDPGLHLLAHVAGARCFQAELVLVDEPALSLPQLTVSSDQS